MDGPPEWTRRDKGDASGSAVELAGSKVLQPGEILSDFVELNETFDRVTPGQWKLVTNIRLPVIWEDKERIMEVAAVTTINVSPDQASKFNLDQRILYLRDALALSASILKVNSAEAEPAIAVTLSYEGPDELLLEFPRQWTRSCIDVAERNGWVAKRANASAPETPDLHRLSRDHSLQGIIKLRDYYTRAGAGKIRLPVNIPVHVKDSNGDVKFTLSAGIDVELTPEQARRFNGDSG